MKRVRVRSAVAAPVRYISLRILLSVLLPSLFAIQGEAALAQAKTSKPGSLVLPLPLSMEWSESFNPLASTKFAVDRFRLSGGTRSIKLQFSNQAPGFLGGKQFQGLPGGYRLAEFSLTRKWVSLHGFRSVGYSPRVVRPESARSMTGAGVEVPKFLLQARMSAYFFRATPAARSRPSGSSSEASNGTQIGLNLKRELRKGTTLLGEWTQTQNSPMFAYSSGPARQAARARRGLLIRLNGSLAGAGLNASYLSRDEGLANPAFPADGPARRSLMIDVDRKVRQHQFQFTSQLDGQRALPRLGIPVREVREETMRWTFAPRRLPQIAAERTWSRQTSAIGRQCEDSFRLSLSKEIRRISSRLAFFHSSLSEARSSRALWDRMVISGDTTMGIPKNRRLHIRYEKSVFSQHAMAQKISSSSLQLDTRMDFWRDTLSLAPALDLRRQKGSIPSLDISAARILFSTVLKLPHYVPGTDFFLNFSSHRIRAAGSTPRTGTEFSLRWNFKRL